MNIKTYNQIFSENLNYVLKKTNKRQIDLSKDLNIPKATVSSWCKGTRIPKLCKLLLVANYLNINDPTLFLRENIQNYIN